MSITHRIMMCRMLEKMEQYPEYSKKLGLENVSVFHGAKRNAAEGAEHYGNGGRE